MSLDVKGSEGQTPRYGEPQPGFPLWEWVTQRAAKRPGGQDATFEERSSGWAHWVHGGGGRACRGLDLCDRSQREEDHDDNVADDDDRAAGYDDDAFNGALHPDRRRHRWPPTLTADPGTCLTGGTSDCRSRDPATTPSPLGIVLQCNNDPSQPEVVLGGRCNPKRRRCPARASPLRERIMTTSTGAFLRRGAPSTADRYRRAARRVTSSLRARPTRRGETQRPMPRPIPAPDAAQLAAGDSCTSPSVTGRIRRRPCRSPYTHRRRLQAAVEVSQTTTTTAPAATRASTGARLRLRRRPPRRPQPAASPSPAPAPASTSWAPPASSWSCSGAAVLGLSGAPSSLMLAMRRRRRNN